MVFFRKGRETPNQGSTRVLQFGYLYLFSKARPFWSWQSGPCYLRLDQPHQGAIAGQTTIQEGTSVRTTLVTPHTQRNPRAENILPGLDVLESRAGGTNVTGLHDKEEGKITASSAVCREKALSRKVHCSHSRYSEILPRCCHLVLTADSDSSRLQCSRCEVPSSTYPLMTSRSCLYEPSLSAGR